MSEASTRGVLGRLVRFVPIVCGVVSVLGWLTLVAALFAGMDPEDSAVAFTVALLVAVVVTALSTVPARSAGTVVAVVSALLYVAVWAYLRFAFDSTMPDAVLYVLTAVFYLAPLVTAITAIVVGVRRR